MTRRFKNHIFTLKIGNYSPSSRFLHLRSHSSSSAPTSFSSILQGRISRSHLLQIHAQVYRTNANQDNLIATRLIGQYPPTSALLVFKQLRNPNIYPFNAIIRVLGEDGNLIQTFIIFKALLIQSVSPNDFTFSFLFKAILRSKDEKHLKQIHPVILKLGYCCESSVCNGLMSVYAKGIKDLVSARKVFDEMPDKGLVSSWTNLISGFAQSGHADEVLRLFCMMIEQNLQPGDDTLVSVLSACSILDIAQIDKWVKLLEKFNSNSINVVLVHLYGKCGNIEKSKDKFDEIDDIGKRSVLPWNAMITSFVQNNCPIEALNLFRFMMDDRNRDHDRKPNHVTMVNVLSACSQIGDLDLGIWIHDYMKSNGRNRVLETNQFLATALIDMYSKCGSLSNARSIFEDMVSKDVVSFNAMIMGLATNGEGETAMNMFTKMQELGIKPNAGTFLGLLSACNHSGMTEIGRRIFRDMESRFSVTPAMEHYACHIDLLARGGFVEEALEVVETMPFEANGIIWGGLLGGCLIHSRWDLGMGVYRRVVELDCGDSGGYVMLANAFANDRKWGEVCMVRWLMKEKGVKKHPGCSWIGINGVVHQFLVGSSSHLEIEEICSTLNGLFNVMKVVSL